MTISNILECLSGIDRGEIEFGVVEELSETGTSTGPEGHKQALVFLKPELLYSERTRSAALQTVVDVLGGAGMSVHGAAVLGPRRLARIIPLHYGVINRVSRLGLAALSAAATTALETTFGDEMRSGMPALGGHQILQSTGISAQRLAERISGQAPKKLAPGTYATKLPPEDGADAVIALNGFHPEQLEHYTAENARVVVLEVKWTKPAWHAFRSDVIGATDPVKANSASIRGVLHAQREAMSIGDVTISRNGIHGSAGPFEAMVELSRFFGVSSADTAFGHLLLQAEQETTRSLAVYDAIGGAVAQQMFDATEDAEPDSAVKTLADLQVKG